MALYRDYLHERMTRLAASATVEGVPPLTLPKSAGKALKDYKVWGKSVQDGTPTPETPIEVQSVGELVTDVADPNYGKNKIPVQVTSGNSTVTTNIYLDEPLRGIGQAWDYVDFARQKVVRAIRRVDLGELNWYKNSTYSVYLSTGTVFPAVQGRDSEIFCEKYEAQAKDWTTLDDKHIVLIRGLSVSGYYSCVVKDLDVGTSTEFKTLMNGVYLFCKYITPTEESITLPSVLTQKGSCILGIGTTIQPNKVSATYIKG